MPAPLGKSNNYPRSVMNRLGGDPARVVLEPVGGQGPQKLVTEAGNAIVAGDADVVMIMRLRAGLDGRGTSPTGTTSRTSPSTSTVSSRTAATGSTAYIDEYTDRSTA